MRLNCGDTSYIVEDVTGYSERVWREDIITDADQLGKRYVIALHPQHDFSYCPGTAQDFDDQDDDVVVKFYDGLKAKVPLSEVFPIPREKHAVDVQYIVHKENELVGQVVVAWNQLRRSFELGKLPLCL